MNSLDFKIVAQAKAENAVNDFCNFSQNGPCDMCWGDLSL